jgi:hypothetical protein
MICYTTFAQYSPDSPMKKAAHTGGFYTLYDLLTLGGGAAYGAVR